MSSKKQKSYNDHELCEDIAGGTLTRKQIANKHGLSEHMVGDIARGDKRTELKPIIDKISEAYITEGRRIARSRSRKTMKRLDEIMDSDDEDTALKAIKHLHSISGLDQTDEGSSDLKAVVIKTPFAINVKQTNKNSKGGNGRKNNNRKKNSKSKED